MGSRCLNKKSADAVKMTIVPLGDFRVNSMIKYHALGVMAEVMPNLQQITLNSLGYNHKYNDGEDPDERRSTGTADDTTHDIDIISNFSKLRILKISHPRTSLNGRYPVFFHFPLLQKLRIIECNYLKWDLEMLAGMHLLKELECSSNPRLAGNISSLNVLKGTLEKVNIRWCDYVEGNFMDMADFPNLKVLELFDTAVTGDIRDISENDFSSLEHLALPKGVYGGRGYEFGRISDAPDLVNTLYLLVKQRPALSLLKEWYGCVHEDSPDFYDSVEDAQGYCPMYPSPLYICFVQAGPRIGYRWQDYDSSSDNEHDQYSACEVIWLDPEPEKESSDYGKYINELQEINSQESVYKGFHLPPTEAEYRGLVTPLVRREGLPERYYDEESDEEYDIEEW